MSGRHADSERTQAICKAFLRGAEVQALADKYGIQRPAIYKQLRAGGAVAAYKPGPQKRARLSSIELAAQAPAPVFRDPCPRCGIRADVGCSHGWRR